MRGGGRAGGWDDGARHTDGASERATGGEGEGAVDSGGGNKHRPLHERPSRMRETGAVRLRTDGPPQKTLPHSQRWLYNTPSTPSGHAASVHGIGERTKRAPKPAGRSDERE